MTARPVIRERSIFLPLVLIAVGVLWLLGNAGILSLANLNMLARLWPLILITLGAYILINPKYNAIRLVVALGGIGLIVLLTLIGPALGWARGMDVQTAQYNEPVGDAASANIKLDLTVGNADVGAVADDGDLFTADIHYIGDIRYDVTGGANKQIVLHNEGSGGFAGLGWTLPNEQLDWNIGLSPAVPLTLQVNGGAGNADLNLSAMRLTDLTYNVGAGNLALTLPGQEPSYSVSLNGGAGEMRIDVEEGAALTLSINGGVGNTVLEVPRGAAVRIQASTGVGNISVPSDWRRVSGDSSGDFIGKDGVWESPGFSAAGRTITVHYSGGVGNLTVR